MSSDPDFSINSSALQNLLTAAANKYGIPVKTLVTALYVENCRGAANICKLTDAEIAPYMADGVEYPLNCPGGGTDDKAASVSKGIFQMYHNICSDENGNGVCDSSDPLVHWGRFRENPGDNICNIPDAMYAAANLLRYNYDFPPPLSPRTSDENSKTALSRWAYGPSAVCTTNDYTQTYCDYYDDIICN